MDVDRWREYETKLLHGHEATIADLRAQLAAAEEWKSEVQNAAIIHWCLTNDNENDPKKMLPALIKTATDWALDPRISSEAQALVDMLRPQLEAAEAERDLLRDSNSAWAASALKARSDLTATTTLLRQAKEALKKQRAALQNVVDDYGLNAGNTFAAGE